MTWHDLLVTAEQALVWATASGIVARIFLRRPLRTLLHVLIAHAVHQAQAADRLDTSTPGGLADIVAAIENAGPPPDAPRRR